jgi:uncharacterized protein YoxC
MNKETLENIIKFMDEITHTLRLLSNYINKVEDRHDKMLSHMIEAMTDMNNKINKLQNKSNA